VTHNTAQNSFDNRHSYHPDNSSMFIVILFVHKNMTADNTRTGPTRLAKHSQWPQ